MGADAHQRLIRKTGRHQEVAVVLAREEQRPVGEHAQRLESRAQAVGHGAQILADDQAAVALALQGEDAEQVVERIGDVGALGRRCARRHPEQAGQVHHVVDAQRAAMAHVGAQRGDERGVGGIAQAVRHEGRQAPVLTVQVEVVGRRAGVRPRGIDALTGPGLGAARARSHREILIQADAQAQAPGMFAGLGQLQLRLPLQVGIEVGLGGVRPGESGHRRSVRVLVFGRPGRPAPDRGIPLAKVRLQRLEQRVAGQRFAPLGAEAAEGVGALASRRQVTVAEVPIGARQRCQLQRRDRLVIDQL